MAGGIIRRAARVLGAVGVAAALAACIPAGSVDESYGGPTGRELACSSGGPVVGSELGGALLVACGTGLSAASNGVRVHALDDAGAPVAAFGGSGSVDVPLDGVNLHLLGVARAPDGDVVVAGRVAPGDYRLYRYGPDGTLDTGFGVSSPVGSTVGYARLPSARASVTGGVLTQAGDLTVIATQEALCAGCGTFEGLRVHVYDGAGPVRTPITVPLADQADPVPDGATEVRVTLTPQAVDVDLAGRITIAGRITTSYLLAGSFGGTDNDAAVVRLLPDGTRDPDFGEAGVARFDLSFDGDGQPTLGLGENQSPWTSTIAGGETTFAFFAGFTAPTVPGAVFLRVDGTGALDTSFGGDGIAHVPDQVHLPQSIAVDQEGRTLIGSSPQPAAPATLRRLLPDGSLDPAFDGDGVALLPGGRASTVLVSTPVARYLVVVLGWDGHTDAHAFRVGH